MKFPSISPSFMGALAAGLIAIGAMTGANAQMTPDVNCAALAGSPMMCVKNASSFPVTGIMATSGMTFSGSYIPIPGGPIAPGGTAVVRFPAWQGDYQNIFVKTASGQTHSFPHVDVRHNTSFVIRGW